MIGWAQDRVARELPQLNQRTVRMLLRAEARTVSAVLHCKSTIQLKEVMMAAYRRAGMVPPQNTGGAEEEDSHQQTDNAAQAASSQYGAEEHRAPVSPGQRTERGSRSPGFQQSKR